MPNIFIHVTPTNRKQLYIIFLLFYFSRQILLLLWINTSRGDLLRQTKKNVEYINEHYRGVLIMGAEMWNMWASENICA